MDLQDSFKRKVLTIICRKRPPSEKGSKRSRSGTRLDKTITEDGKSQELSVVPADSVVIVEL
jgi:hypothetical protein